MGKNYSSLLEQAKDMKAACKSTEGVFQLIGKRDKDGIDWVVGPRDTELGPSLCIFPLQEGKRLKNWGWVPFDFPPEPKTAKPKQRPRVKKVQP